MRALLGLSLVLVMLGVCSAAALLPVKHRVENAKPGVCWFCCVESIAAANGREDVKGLKEMVISTGIGRLGASWQDKQYWQGMLGFKVYQVSRQYWSIWKRVEAKQHVIATMHPWLATSDQAHAIVILDMTRDKERALSDDGTLVHDYWVTYFDPNTPHLLRHIEWSRAAKLIIYAEVLAEE